MLIEIGCAQNGSVAAGLVQDRCHVNTIDTSFEKRILVPPKATSARLR